MKKALLFFLSVIPSLALFSQEDSLLKNFRYRISNYRAINLNIGGSGELLTTNQTGSNVTNRTAQSNVAASYFALKSTDSILLTTTAALYGGFTGTASKTAMQESTNRNFNVNPTVNILNKWFAKSKFTELGVDVAGAANSGKNNNPAGQGGIYMDNNARYSVAINTGIGTGRLENVTDMQNAIWLNQALKSAGQLLRPLSFDELNELGRTITLANNTRVLDNRRRTQFVLKTVDDYLQQKGVIKKTDVAYFSNLNDILFFAFNSPRFSGTEKFIRLTPGITGYGRNENSEPGQNKFKQRLTDKSILLSAGISKYSPQNLIHQNNYGASVIGSLYNLDFSQTYVVPGTSTVTTKGNSTLKRAGINLFYEHAIYPNTRTSISFNLQTQGGYQDLDSSSNFFGLINMGGSLNYFISYRTRFTAGLGALYQKNYYTLTPYLQLAPDNIQLYGNAGFAISL